MRPAAPPDNMGPRRQISYSKARTSASNWGKGEAGSNPVPLVAAAGDAVPPSTRPDADLRTGARASAAEIGSSAAATTSMSSVRRRSTLRVMNAGARGYVRACRTGAHGRTRGQQTARTAGSGRRAGRIGGAAVQEVFGNPAGAAGTGETGPTIATLGHHHLLVPAQRFDHACRRRRLGPAVEAPSGHAGRFRSACRTDHRLGDRRVVRRARRTLPDREEGDGDHQHHAAATTGTGRIARRRPAAGWPRRRDSGHLRSAASGAVHSHLPAHRHETSPVRSQIPGAACPPFRSTATSACSHCI